MKKNNLLSLVIAASVAWLASTSTNAQTLTTDGMQGMNWACGAGNGAGTPYPDGLTGSHNYEQAFAVGQRIGNAIKNAGGKSVRMPITPTLAAGTPWWRYGGAINGVTSTGTKVILCHWPATGTRLVDKNAWLTMWDTVNSSYGSTMMVRYEPINEPAEYSSTELRDLYAEFLNRYNPAAYKCILDGTGYADNVLAIGNDSRFNNQLLGLHAYHWYFGSTSSWQTDYNAMANAVGSHAWRTVVSEIGVQTVNNSGTFWQKWEPSMTSDIALLSGGLAWARDNNVATIAWSGVNDSDNYHWFVSNSNLTEANVGVADMFRWGWKQKNSVTAGTYRLQNRANGKYLDNLGATTDGANVGQQASGSSNNQKWKLTQLNSVWFKLQCVTGGKYLDGMGRTADGSNIGQRAGGSSNNQQWAISATDSGYYKIINRTTGKCLDTGGQTANGAIMQNWSSGSSYNQQWRFVP